MAAPGEAPGVASALDLDRWLPEPSVHTRHERDADASADRLWESACSLTIGEVGTLGRLLRWRIPKTPPERTFLELFSSYPFVVLEDGPCLLVSGLCGRIWTLARDYPRLDFPEDFRAWDRTGTVKVVFGHQARNRKQGGAELVSEARVSQVGGGLRIPIRFVRAFVRRFERLIADEALTVAARRVEGRRGGGGAD